MKLKSVACLLASAALCVSMVGCAGESQTQSDSQQVDTVSIDATPIEIIQSGFSTGNDGEVNYAFTLKNPNDGFVADRVTLSISGYDSEGGMVLGAAESIEHMFPGIEYAVSGTTFMAGSGAIDRLEVVPSMDVIGWIPTETSSEAAADMFSVANPRSGRLSNGSVSIGGRVVANDAEVVAKVEGVDVDGITAKVCAILVDTEGNFLGGGTAGGLVFNEEESVIREEASTDAGSGNQTEDSSDRVVLKAAPFDISISSSPGFKECRYYVMPA